MRWLLMLVSFWTMAAGASTARAASNMSLLGHQTCRAQRLPAGGARACARCSPTTRPPGRQSVLNPSRAREDTALHPRFTNRTLARRANHLAAPLRHISGEPG